LDRSLEGLFDSIDGSLLRAGKDVLVLNKPDPYPMREWIVDAFLFKVVLILNAILRELHEGWRNLPMYLPLIVRVFRDGWLTDVLLRV